jgi:hypothetical protein
MKASRQTLTATSAVDTRANTIYVATTGSNTVSVIES